MKISDLINELEFIKSNNGDIEVTCTATSLPDDVSLSGVPNIPDVWESTVETTIIHTDTKFGKRVRLYF